MSEDIEKIKLELKENIIEALGLEDFSPDDISDDDPLFGGELDLDSLDAVEIVVILQRKFGVDTKGLESRKEVFSSINTLAEFIAGSKNQ